MVKVIAKGMGVTPGRAVSPLLWEKARRKGYGRSKFDAGIDHDR